MLAHLQLAPAVAQPEQRVELLLELGQREIERALGVDLLKRTTRTLSLTPAGEYLFGEAARLLGDVESSLRFLQQEFADAPKEVRVDVSRSVGLEKLEDILGEVLSNTEQLKTLGDESTKAGE